MIDKRIIDNDSAELLRRCVMFYLAISTKEPLLEYSGSTIEAISQNDIHRALYPVIRDRNSFKLNNAKDIVIDFIKNYIYYTQNDIDFLKEFIKGNYVPELIFDETGILEQIKDHPMAIWKTQNNRIKNIELER